jgi:hypothetical protein
MQQEAKDPACPHCIKHPCQIPAGLIERGDGTKFIGVFGAKYHVVCLRCDFPQCTTRLFDGGQSLSRLFGKNWYCRYHLGQVKPKVTTFTFLHFFTSSDFSL